MIPLFFRDASWLACPCAALRDLSHPHFDAFATGSLRFSPNLTEGVDLEAPKSNSSLTYFQKRMSDGSEVP